MRNPFRPPAVAFAALLLLVAACGDSGDTTTTVAVDATTTTVVATTLPPSPTTTVTATTLPPETTTTAAPATTVAATTTTGAAALGDAQSVVDAKVAAVLAAVPEGWTGMLDPDPTAGGDDTDIIFGPCAGPDAFDLNQLDAMSAAVEQAQVTAPPGSGGGLFPDPEGQVEARVFVSEDVADEAFAVLETVFGTPEGRDCLADTLIGELGAELPDGSEVEFSVDELSVPGADVAIRLTVDINAGGITAQFFIDFAAARMGACTIYSSFQSFGEPFDAEIQATLFSAAQV